MTNEEILQKAIEKAVKNGFENPFGKNRKTVKKEDIWGIYACQDVPDSYFHVIYSHDFAEAFFGEETWIFGWNRKTPADNMQYAFFSPDTKWDISIHSNPIMGVKAWKYHLQQMVILEDPIKYLEQFI